MKKTLIVNLYGAPGASKSTTAALVFGKLKQNGVDCELVREVAKDYVWEDRHIEFLNQVTIMGKQIKRVNSVVNKVDVIVLDSPLLLSGYYNNEYDKEMFNKLCLDTYKFYDNLDVFIERTKAYNPNGRYQTEEESNIIANKLINFLDDIGIKYTKMKGDNDCADKILNLIMERKPELFHGK